MEQKDPFLNLFTKSDKLIIYFDSAKRAKRKYQKFILTENFASTFRYD